MPTPTSTRRSLSSMVSPTCVVCLSGSSACAGWKRRVQVSIPEGMAGVGPTSTVCVSSLILLTQPVWDKASWACRSLRFLSSTLESCGVVFGCVGSVCVAPHSQGQHIYSTVNVTQDTKNVFPWPLGTSPSLHLSRLISPSLSSP